VVGTVTGVGSRIRAMSTRAETRERFRELSPPTRDDVSVSLDGRCLDTPERVRAFLDEVAAIRDAEQASTHL
jgi:hypothetical protein